MFRYLLTLALVMVFGATSYMSVSGLVSVFSANVVLIVVLGAGLELGKILVVVYLHRHWGGLAWAVRVVYGIVIGVLVMITTCEVFGYLSLNHTVATAEAVELSARDKALEEEYRLIMDQVRVIDETVEQLPEGYVTRRIIERDKAGYGEKQARLTEILRARAEIAGEMGRNTSQAGPVVAVAKLAGVDANRVALWFIFVLVGVLEPLSVGLAVAVSAVWGEGFTTEDTEGHRGVLVNHEAHEEHEEEKEVEVVVEHAQELPAAAQGDPNFLRLCEIIRTHNLSAKDIQAITKRAKLETVKGWFEGRGPVPEKAVRAVEKYVRGKPRLRAVS